MYYSDLSEWTAAKMGPKRDLIGDLAKAVKEKGMVFGVSSHRAEHWFFMNGGRDFDADVNDPKYADFYGPATPTDFSRHGFHDLWKSRDWTPRPDAKYLDDWLARCSELIDKYQPQLFYLIGGSNRLFSSPMCRNLPPITTTAGWNGTKALQ